MAQSDTLDAGSLEEILDSFKSIEELDQWSKRWGLTYDHRVNLRRLELCTQDILLQTGEGAQALVMDPSEVFSKPSTSGATIDVQPSVSVAAMDEESSPPTSPDASSGHIQPSNLDSPQPSTSTAQQSGKEPPRKRLRQAVIGSDGRVKLPTHSLEDEDDRTYQIEPVQVKHYSLEIRKERTLKKNMAKEVIYQVKFDNDWQGKRVGDVRNEIRNMFQDAIDRARGGLANDDLGRVYINQGNLWQPIVLHPRPLQELNAEAVMEEVERVLQSEENIIFDDSMEVHVGMIEIPKVGAAKQRTLPVVDQYSLKCKRSVVRVRNVEDELCLARALAVCLAKQTKDPRYDMIRKSERRLQKEKAIELHRRAGVPTNRPCSFNDLPMFEKALDRQIIVYSATKGNKPIYVGEDARKEKLFLYHSFNDDVHRESGSLGHIDAIVNITGFLGKSFFCGHCLKGFQNRNKHKCTMYCRVCFSQCSTQSEDKLICPDCNQTCQSQECFDRHKLSSQRGKSSCLTFWKCLECSSVIRHSKKETHICGEWLCSVCGKWQMGDHFCYMTSKERMQPKLHHIAFDFECTQETTSHRPNFAVVQTDCDHCTNDPLTTSSKCSFCGRRCPKCWQRDKKTSEFCSDPCALTCGHRDFTFEGENTQTDFCQWLFSENNRGATVIAHNAKGYDSYFLLDYLINSVDKVQTVPQIIFSGSKIMYLYLKAYDIRVIDSLNFFPMKLSALPKAFGLTALKKGFFPHYFNTFHNWNYVGPFPPSEDYGVNHMMSAERAEFTQWYEQQRGREFNFRQELENYCRSDVDILRRSCLKFRSLFLEITSGVESRVNADGVSEQVRVALDPFRFITIASVCMAVFQSMFLEETVSVLTKENLELATTEGKLPVWVKATKKGGKFFCQGQILQDVIKSHFIESPIAIVPSQGYISDHTYSKESIEWLLWMEKKLKAEGLQITIQHALNAGEKRVNMPDGRYYKLDGYYVHPQTGQEVALEYLGCFFHGCKKCHHYTSESSNRDPVKQQTMLQRFSLTMKKLSDLKALGFQVVSVWSHQFAEKKKTDPSLKAFLSSVEIHDRLNPRDASFGGRTNAAVLHYKADRVQGQRVLYKDMTSMYPTVNKFHTYPKGHAEIIVKDFEDIHQYFGIAKVTVLPPRGLFHPVLPYRANGKLFFPLCRTCADTMQKTPCTCTDDRRSICGTWVTLKIHKAVEKGYKVLKIHEVYHFPERCEYDPVSKSNGLFSDYVNTFLKYKLEASGWPEHCKDEASKQAYLDFIMEKEGVVLDPSSITVNKGLRSLAKLMLNSFWGKFGQRLNFRQTSITRSENEFYKVLFSGTKIIDDFHILNDEIAQMDWHYKDDFLPLNKMTNIFIAAFTTSHARLLLYDVLDKLQEQVLYYDTDSVVYSHSPGQYDHPTGEGLGEFTDELVCKEVGCRVPDCLGHYISEFWSAGPKNYAYKVDNGHTVCKVRGFTLNHANAKLINFDSFQDVITDYVQGQAHRITVTNPKKISRKKHEQKIFNRREDKSYGMTYTKRVIDPVTLYTYPYGY